MNMQKAALAVAVAAIVAAALPALNWAQETPVTFSEDLAEVNEEVADAVREQEIVIRKASEDAAVFHAAEAEKAAFKAIKSADRHFKIMFDQHGGSPPLAARIREAAAAVRDAKDETTREAATGELNSALDEYFEQDMQARGKELEGIRSRLTKLQAQLDRRRERKGEIIDLQMKVALNEADGLGFYTEPQDPMFNFRVPAPPTPMVMPIKVEVPSRGGFNYGGMQAPPSPQPTAPPAPAAPAAPVAAPR